MWGIWAICFFSGRWLLGAVIAYHRCAAYMTIHSNPLKKTNAKTTFTLASFLILTAASTGAVFPAHFSFFKIFHHHGKNFRIFLPTPPASPLRRNFAGLPFLFLLCLIAFPGFSLRAQNVITVVHNGVTSVYDAVNLQSAITAAPSGASIYLSGGAYFSFTINKQIHIYGAGYFPDSSFATVITTALPSINITSAGDGSTITGVSCGLVLNSGTSGDSLENIDISRCWVNDVNYFSPSGAQAYKNISFRESIILQGANPVKTFFTNCIIGSVSGNICIYRNSIFFDIQNGAGSEYWNCISKPGLGPIANNNIYFNNLNFGTNGSNGSGNIPNAGSFTVLFENETNGTYEFADDLHLVNPAYNTGGTDGTPIGIHGGDWPWKPGGVPFNPHISTKSIGTTTNTSGQLPVNITVRAQGN